MGRILLGWKETKVRWNEKLEKKTGKLMAVGWYWWLKYGVCWHE